MTRDYFRVLEYNLLQERASQTPNERVDNHFNANTPDPLSPFSLNSGYYRKFFVEEKKIGSGGFGSVYQVSHIIDGIQLGRYAVKKVPVGNNKPWLMRVLREVKALETLNKHPNIINYQHSWLEEEKTSDFGPAVPTLFILMELASG